MADRFLIHTDLSQVWPIRTAVQNVIKKSIDDNVHFVLNCESFIPQRNILFDKIELLLPGFKVKSKKLKLFILLNGIYLDSEFPDCRNKHIMFAMQHFILTTKRFEKPS